MFKTLVIPMVTAIQCISVASYAWQVRPDVTKTAAEIVHKRMSHPQNFIPQSQDARLVYTKTHSALQNQMSSIIVDNDEEAVKLIEETYQQLRKDKNKTPFTQEEVEGILSNDTPLNTFLGLTNGTLSLPDFYNTLKVYFNTNKLTFDQVISNISPDM